ncbi:MAG TPA: glutathione S-transferase family protein [Candidatus Binataceae bacterium]|nr:glutathione S-transferase family protein [Candidatus Binataceae bacterium]
MGKLRLYQFATSPFCAKVRKILDYKGADYEIIEVDYLIRGELMLASGQIMVPALTLESGETITDSDRIATRLESEYPVPSIFPGEWRGVHLALARYFDAELEDTLFRAAIPDVIAYYRAKGRDHEAMWRLIRERKYGAGFCDRMAGEHAANLERVREMLTPLDDGLRERAFLLGRIGYADFALYGQLTYLAIAGELSLPCELANLRAFYDRMDRISSTLDPNA